jgi:hypothetical protein
VQAARQKRLQVEEQNHDAEPGAGCHFLHENRALAIGERDVNDEPDRRRDGDGEQEYSRHLERKALWSRLRLDAYHELA